MRPVHRPTGPCRLLRGYGAGNDLQPVLVLQLRTHDQQRPPGGGAALVVGDAKFPDSLSDRLRHPGVSHVPGILAEALTLPVPTNKKPADYRGLFYIYPPALLCTLRIATH